MQQTDPSVHHSTNSDKPKEKPKLTANKSVLGQAGTSMMQLENKLDGPTKGIFKKD